MAMNVSQFQASDNFNMARFNSMASQINSGVNSEVSTLNTAIQNLAASGVKLQLGSYVGTGTYGSSNPCSITFDFVPQYFAIYYINAQYGTGGLGGNAPITNKDYGGVNIINPSTLKESYDGGAPAYNANNPGKAKFTQSSKTLQWYNEYGSTEQYNNSGTKYYWIAIG